MKKKMRTRCNNVSSHSDFHASNLAFAIISLMHDNPLLPIFRNPYKFLKAAGLKPGQKVLEVGCGPGFFTIPAAKIVGNKGLVYAVDIHTRAIEKIQEKTERKRIANVQPILANASSTDLSSESIDLAFLFGLRYIAGGLKNVLFEMHRVLKPRGILSFEKTKGSEKRFIEYVERGGFAFSEKRGRIFSFTKSEDSEKD